MFPTRMRKLDNIYVRQTIRGLFGDIFSFNIKLEVYENLAKTVLRNLRILWSTQQGFRRNMHIHE